MSLPTYQPEANYISRNNIVHPAHSSLLSTAAADAVVTAAEARARVEIASRTGLAVSGGSIRKGK